MRVVLAQLAGRDALPMFTQFFPAKQQFGQKLLILLAHDSVPRAASAWPTASGASGCGTRCLPITPEQQVQVLRPKRLFHGSSGGTFELNAHQGRPYQAS